MNYNSDLFCIHFPYDLGNDSPFSLPHKVIHTRCILIWNNVPTVSFEFQLLFSVNNEIQSQISKTSVKIFIELFCPDLKVICKIHSLSVFNGIGLKIPDSFSSYKPQMMMAIGVVFFVFL